MLVVGHTDDQPIQSLRYQDNYELSRERAVSVVTLLQQGIDNRARLTLDRRRLFETAIPSRSRIRRTARATGAWKSSTSAETDMAQLSVALLSASCSHF